MTVTSSMCDASARLSIPAAIDIFQDIAADHALILGIDGLTIKEKHNAFWAITKTKLRFFGRPAFFEKITAKTWPSKPSGVRCLRNYTVSSEKGLVCEGKSEWVILDYTTRFPKKLSSIDFPTELDYLDDKLSLDGFAKGAPEFSEEDFVYSRQIRYCETDLSRHMNNAYYCRYVLDTFDESFFDENERFELDISYICESKIGDTVKIYRRQDGDGYVFGLMRDDTLLCVTRLKLI
ncbi:MAG: acyl-[acyl-carrier-protein] thioesterase [Oscillospiraceae bacterium]